ncbi:hypothetical protein B0H17DRAFT_1161347 [Mycena rosella]|uniref:Uncharacterized protein n=1 Tax=Mycena rosella TaxID=1033263 RepID=A0AAD7D470_MYCRO|nr:hypothetical protein B0H17DRAFT_1161347 [Mycena rosella]
MEPTEETLSFFVVYMCSHISPDSVDSYLSGICNQLEDHFPDIRKNRNSRLVSKTLAGCKRLRGSAKKRKQPLTIHHLITVINWLQERVSRGELTYPDKKELRNTCQVSQRDSVSWCPTGYGYFLPGHKADAFFEGNTLIIEKLNGPTDPHKPFCDYLRSCDYRALNITTCDALFPYHPQLWLRANGTVPTRSWFMKRLRKFFPVNIAGQSMRAGGATRLAESGAMPHIYIRKNPILLQGMIHSRPAFNEPSTAIAR